MALEAYRFSQAMARRRKKGRAARVASTAASAASPDSSFQELFDASPAPPQSGGKKGFNSPFAELGESLRKSARSLAKERARASKQYSRDDLPPPLPPSSRSRETKLGISDEQQLFEEAYRGVKKIEGGTPRVRAVPHVDLGDIEAAARAERKAELAELACAAGFNISFSDQYVRGRGHGVSRETLAELEKGRFAVRAHLDLHGLVLDEALRKVDDFVRERQRLGDRCVLLITGKGRNSPGQFGILREEVPRWLAKGPSARRVLAFVTARKCDGGEGALYVLLRKGAAGKGRIDMEIGGVGALSD